MGALGRQLVVEFWGCRGNLDSAELIRQTLEEAVQKAKAFLLDIKVHKFQPHGISGVAVIAESHVSIHTWPEHGYAAVDVFTCGNTDPEAAVEHIRQALKPRRVKVIKIERGILQGEQMNLERLERQYTDYDT
ncbi:MAG TPA: adenosylmethionine decarboxylase [Chloroflexi bacterium]|nr:adenosylmethionine decarboxylase [Chloroflexota bacterium]